MRGNEQQALSSGPMAPSGGVFPALSDFARAAIVYDNFSGVTGAIAHVRWWGFGACLEDS